MVGNRPVRCVVTGRAALFTETLMRSAWSRLQWSSVTTHSIAKGRSGTECIHSKSKRPVYLVQEGCTTAKQIKNLRDSMGLSVRAFAKRAGVAHTTVVRWENGTNNPKGLQLERLVRLAKRAAKK